MSDDADEEDFLHAIFASERIERWLELIREGPGKKRAIFELLTAMQDSAAYSEEARRAGAVGCMTALLKTSTDEPELDAAASVVSLCSGPMACGGKVRSFDYGQGVQVSVREGSLGDGLGSKVWSVSHAFSRLLVNNSGLVKGKKVLEIGAGCGINGIVASNIGAGEVTLSDVELPVLQNCARCMMLNCQGNSEDSISWDCGNMKTRFLDWADSLLLDQKESNRAIEIITGQASTSTSSTAISCPSVPRDETFEVVLGNEVMYEPLHARLVASVVAHKLAKGGCCILCCAVRDLSTFSVFKSECAKRGLVYRDAAFELSGERGLMGKVTDYEGGFLLIMVDLNSSPFQGHWPSLEGFSKAI